jgi:hypothetical protein
MQFQSRSIAFFDELLVDKQNFAGPNLPRGSWSLLVSAQQRDKQQRR